jgi:hypothetical protein
MTKKLIGATGLATLALAGGAFGGAVSPGIASASGGSTTVRSAEDVSGPCDEAEHRNDPRCNGGTGVERREDDRGTSGKHRRGKGKGDSGHGRSGRG